MSTNVTSGIQRVTVDPNRASRLHPGCSPVLLEDLKRTPTVGERVVAVQPDEMGLADYVGTATVRSIDQASGLVFLDVDWSSFRDEVRPSRAASANAKGRIYLHRLGGLLDASAASGNTTRPGRVKVA